MKNKVYTKGYCLACEDFLIRTNQTKKYLHLGKIKKDVGFCKIHKYLNRDKDYLNEKS